VTIRLLLPDRDFYQRATGSVVGSWVTPYMQHGIFWRLKTCRYRSYCKPCCSADLRTRVSEIAVRCVQRLFSSLLLLSITPTITLRIGRDLCNQGATIPMHAKLRDSAVKVATWQRRTEPSREEGLVFHLSAYRLLTLFSEADRIT
jgi:hypothetical protein